MVYLYTDCVPSLSQFIFTLISFYTLKFVYSYCSSIKTYNKQSKIRKEDWKKDVVYFYQFPRPKYMPQLSPFCLKIEAFLRLHGIKHEIVSNFYARSEKGQLPFIELNGEHVADSQIIILHLQRHFNIQDTLTQEQKAIERAFYRMFEGSFWAAANWCKVKDNGVEFLGELLRLTIGSYADMLKYPLVYWFNYEAKRRFTVEGTGRHSNEEILEILRADLYAIQTYLGDKDFFFGVEPSDMDVIIFGHVAAIHYVPYRHLSKDLIKTEFPKILEHMRKIEKKFFSEFKFVQ